MKGNFLYSIEGDCGINTFTANIEISSLFIHIYQKSTFFQTYQNINICFQVMSECNVLNHILSLYLLQGVANFSSRYPQHFYIFCNMLKAGENNNFIVESSPKCLNSKFRSWKIFSSKKPMRFFFKLPYVTLLKIIFVIKYDRSFYSCLYAVFL